MHQPSPVPSVSPVVYKGSRGGQRVRAIHHPFPQSTIRDLCKAHRDYGRDSPYFRGLLRSDLDAAVVIPADLKQLFSCLLDSTEFKLWVAAWRQQLREALPSLLRDPETAVDDNGNPLTLEHLMGEGRWADPSDQTSDIPIKALQIAREHAVSAFFGMVPDGPVVPYYKIMQGAKESFTKFVERLTRAIEVQVTEVVPILVTSSRHEPYRLRLTEALHLRTADWTFLSINIKEQGAWQVQGKELVIIGDSAGQAIIYHYMDDVLVCAPNDDMLSHVLGLTVDALVAAGFELQEEKVQRMPPWKYLGLKIGKRTIVPQKLAIKTKVSSLADVHQLCGALNWVRPWLGLTTNDLAPLFNLLKGGEELSSPRVLTPEAEKALEKVQDAMSKRQAHRFDPELPFKFIIMGKLPHLHGMIFQWRNIPKKDREGNDPLSIMEWVFLNHQRSKRMTRPQELVAELIRKARFRIRELAGSDFEWEKAGDAIKHLIHAFSFMGIPRELKTDNGPAYKSRELRSFLQQWGVEHKTGIPHSPTGQAMVERTHGTIKRVLHQQQRVLKTESPSVRLARALFTINFLNCSYEGLNPPIVRHFGASSLFGVKERPQVMVRDPGSGGTEGPHDLVTWGRGYAGTRVRLHVHPHGTKMDSSKVGEALCSQKPRVWQNQQSASHRGSVEVEKENIKRGELNISSGRSHPFPAVVKFK
ncbi:hypothetical protein DUI87_03076 [Hirundo rustica rustica]|uniref:ribonuclease H n=1 Tax=Hirundo rustica rustica TaxID=333673 RepID=A0A3M0L9C2_HIRRU|nr:hypothetical protein DUI87_03076 [Hirundo rustica rustica]